MLAPPPTSSRTDRGRRPAALAGFVDAAGLTAVQGLVAVLLQGKLAFDDSAGALGRGRFVGGFRVRRRRARFV